MLPGYFIVLTFALRLLGGFAYIRAVATGKAKPNMLSWLLWSITPLIVVIADSKSGLTIASLATLALAISPLLVFFTALIRRSGMIKLDAANIACGLLAVLGIMLWQATNQPLLAIIFAILADIASTIPTVRKIAVEPETEYAPTYLMGVGAMLIALLTIREWTFSHVAFPTYVMIINLIIVMLIVHYTQKVRASRKKPRRRHKKS